MNKKNFLSLGLILLCFVKFSVAQNKTLLFSDLYKIDTIIAFPDFQTTSLTSSDLMGYYNNHQFYFASKKENLITENLKIYSISIQNFKTECHVLKLPDDVRKKLSKTYFKIKNLIVENDTVWIQLYQDVLEFVQHQPSHFEFSRWLKTNCKGSQFYKDHDLLITTDATMGKISCQTFHLQTLKKQEYEFVQNYPYMTYMSPIHFTDYKKGCFYYSEADRFCLNKYPLRTLQTEKICYAKMPWHTTLTLEAERLNAMSQFYDRFDANFELFKSQPTILFSYLLNPHSILVNYRNFNPQGKLQTFWDLYQIRNGNLVPLVENVSDQIPLNHILKNGDLFFTVTDGRCRCRYFDDDLGFALVFDSLTDYCGKTFKEFLDEDNQYFKQHSAMLKLYIYKLNSQYYEKNCD